MSDTPRLPETEQLNLKDLRWMGYGICRAAADEIEQLRKEVARLNDAQSTGLREALDAIIKESETIIGNVPFNNAIAAAKAALGTAGAGEAMPKPDPHGWEIGKNGWDASDEATREDI